MKVFRTAYHYHVALLNATVDARPAYSLRMRFSHYASSNPHGLLESRTLFGGELNPVGARSDLVESDFDDIAVLQPKLGLAAHTDTLGSSGEDDVAGQERGTPAQKGNGLLDGEDHV